MAALEASSHVSTQTVGKAVDALLKWIKAQAKHAKAQLLEHDEFIYVVLSLKKIPVDSRTNPYKIPLPHSLHPLDGSEEICLIIDDRSRQHHPLTGEDAKKKIKAESIPVSKVIKISKLKTDYKPFEAKRKLSGSYDLFFADKRVLPTLPRLLGKHFFKKKKIPIPIDLTHRNWKEQIEHACNSALLYLRTGTCCILKVGRVSQGRDKLVENVMAAIEGAACIVPKKWSNIRSLHLKSLESVALPIYQALPDMSLKIEGYKQEDVGEFRKDDTVQEIKVDDKRAEKEVRSRSGKRGRIHEVRYMDGDIDKLMTDIAGDDVGETGELNGPNEASGKEKKKRKEVTDEAKQEKGKKIKNDVPGKEQNNTSRANQLTDGEKQEIEKNDNVAGKENKKKCKSNELTNVEKQETEKKNADVQFKPKRPKKKGEQNLEQKILSAHTDVDGNTVAHVIEESKKKKSKTAKSGADKAKSRKEKI